MASTELQQKLQKRRSLQGENAAPIPSPSPRREHALVMPKSVSGSVRDRALQLQERNRGRARASSLHEHMEQRKAEELRIRRAEAEARAQLAAYRADSDAQSAEAASSSLARQQREAELQAKGHARAHLETHRFNGDMRHTPAATPASAHAQAQRARQLELANARAMQARFHDALDGAADNDSGCDGSGSPSLTLLEDVRAVSRRAADIEQAMALQEQGRDKPQLRDQEQCQDAAQHAEEQQGQEDMTHVVNAAGGGGNEEEDQGKVPLVACRACGKRLPIDAVAEHSESCTVYTITATGQRKSFSGSPASCITSAAAAAAVVEAATAGTECGSQHEAQAESFSAYACEDGAGGSENRCDPADAESESESENKSKHGVDEAINRESEHGLEHEADGEDERRGVEEHVDGDMDESGREREVNNHETDDDDAAGVHVDDDDISDGIGGGLDSETGAAFDDKADDVVDDHEVQSEHGDDIAVEGHDTQEQSHADAAQPPVAPEDPQIPQSPPHEPAKAANELLDAIADMQPNEVHDVLSSPEVHDETYALTCAELRSQLGGDVVGDLLSRVEKTRADKQVAGEDIFEYLTRDDVDEVERQTAIGALQQSGLHKLARRICRAVHERAVTEHAAAVEAHAAAMADRAPQSPTTLRKAAALGTFSDEESEGVPTPAGKGAGAGGSEGDAIDDPDPTGVLELQRLQQMGMVQVKDLDTGLVIDADHVNEKVLAARRRSIRAQGLENAGHEV